MDRKVIIFLLFVGFMTIASFGSIFFYYNSTEGVLMGQTNEYFEAIVQSRANHVQDFLEQEKEKMNILVNNHHFSDLLLISSGRIPGYEGYNFEHFQKVLESFNRGGFYEVFVLDANGSVVATTNPEEEIGEDLSTDLLFLKGKEGTYMRDLYFDEEFNKIGGVVSSPIIMEDEVLGVAAARISPEGLYEILLDRTGLGETGKTYLINGENYIISPLRFGKNVILEQKINTTNVVNCFKAREQAGEHRKKGSIEHIGHGVVDIFLDYRGVEVLGTHVYIFEMDWCLLAEINEREAVGLLRDELIKSALFILIITTIIMGIFIVVSNRFLLGGKKR